MLCAEQREIKKYMISLVSDFLEVLGNPIGTLNLFSPACSTEKFIFNVGGRYSNQFWLTAWQGFVVEIS